jgi:threonylcarbamoyladenosine tRNA methylthiotransferase MtaB
VVDVASGTETAARSVCIAMTSGCPRAEADMATLFSYCQANGWRVTDSIARADVVLVVACGVDGVSERLALRLLRRANRRRRRDSSLVVLGCLAGIIPRRLQEDFGALAVPPICQERLDEILGATVPWQEIAEPTDVAARTRQARRCFHTIDRFCGHFEISQEFGHKLLSGVRRQFARLRRCERDPEVVPLRIAWGCLGNCSYCAVRPAKGPLRSRPPEDVLAYFAAALAAGRRSFDLIADDAGAYGQDLGITIVDLLGQIFARPEHFCLNLIDINPQWLVRYGDALCRLLAANTGRTGECRVPTQSGSSAVLRRMRRQYTADEARGALRRLRAAAPGVQLTTQVIIGFPGETMDEFQETIEFCQATAFDGIRLFRYSDRPGTCSSTMPDKVPGREIRRRVRMFRKALTGTSRITS